MPHLVPILRTHPTMDNDLWRKDSLHFLQSLVLARVLCNLLLKDFNCLMVILGWTHEPFLVTII